MEGEVSNGEDEALSEFITTRTRMADSSGMSLLSP